jgi:hypothetical protein
VGYTTNLYGAINITPALKPEHKKYLTKFSATRRMKRVATLLQHEPDEARANVHLPLGPEGAYFVGSRDPFGQDYDHVSVLDTDEPPLGQPGLWCHWVPSTEGQALVWNECEKFYHFDLWLEYLITHFFKVWGYTLEGTVRWVGEDPNDQGTIYVAENEVFALPDELITDLLQGSTL